MISNRSDVGAICCALMLVAAPFDVAIPEDGFGPWFIRPLMSLIALLALAAIVINRDRLDPSLVRASALFVAALATASAVSDDPALGYAVTLRIGVAVLVFLATSVSVTELREARILVLGAAVMAISASLIGFAVLVKDADLFFTDSLVGKISVTNGVTRLTRPFSQANVAAMALVPISVLLIVASVADTDTSRGRRALSAIGGVLAGLACVLTLSRGGVVAMVVALTISAVMLLRLRGGLNWLLPSAVALTAGTAWLWLPRWGERVGGASSAELGAPTRTEIWGQAIDAFRSQPLTGTGPGQFGRYSVDAASEGVAPSPHAHNLVLEILATAGLIGAVSLAILAYFVIRRVAQGSGRSLNELPFLMASVAAVVHAIVDYPLVFTSSGVVVAVVIGGAVGMVASSDGNAYLGRRSAKEDLRRG
jgi:O-antigen ligase